FESVADPVPSSFDQARSCRFISEFRTPVSNPVGGIITTSPVDVSSARSFRFSVQNSQNSSGVIRSGPLYRSMSKRTDRVLAGNLVGMKVSAIVVVFISGLARVSSIIHHYVELTFRIVHSLSFQYNVEKKVRIYSAF